YRHTLHPVAQIGHGARGLATGKEVVFSTLWARALIGLDNTHPGSGRFDQDLAMTRRWYRDLTPLKIFWTSSLGNYGGIHIFWKFNRSLSHSATLHSGRQIPLDPPNCIIITHTAYFGDRLGP